MHFQTETDAMTQERIKKYPIRLGASFAQPSSTAASVSSSTSTHCILDLPDALHSSKADLSHATAAMRRNGFADRVQATIPSPTANPVHLVTSSVTQPAQHEVLFVFSPNDQCFYLERGAPTHTMRITDHPPAPSPAHHPSSSSSTHHASRARSPLSPSYSDTEPMHMDLDSPEPSSGSVLRAPYEAPSVPVSFIAARIPSVTDAAASPLAGYGSASVGHAGSQKEGYEDKYGDPMDVDSAPPPPPLPPHVHTSSDSTIPTSSSPNPPAPNPAAAAASSSDMDDQEEGQISSGPDTHTDPTMQPDPDADADIESTNDLDLDLEFAGQDEAMRSPTPRGTSVSPHVGVGGGQTTLVSRSVSRSPQLPPVTEAGAVASSPPVVHASEDAVAAQVEAQKKKVTIMSLSSRLGLAGGDEEEDEESSSGSDSD